MKKNKLYILFSFLTLAILFATSAVCNQCATTAEPPTIELQIHDGPNYSESDDMCYYQIEATVTGTPDPIVEFSTNNNINSLENGIVEVGVNAGDSYTLTATATNDSGTATASITLLGECGEEVAEGKETTEEETGEESEEEAADVEDSVEGEGEAPTIALEIYRDATYVEDGDICYYRIEAILSGKPTPRVTWGKDDSLGTLGNTIAQVNLSRGETYTLTATATNSSGSATDSITLTWGCDLEEVAGEEEGPEVAEILINEAYIYPNENLSGIVFASGHIQSAREHSMIVFVGDSTSAIQSKGYLSFDITELHGREVQNAEIRFINLIKSGNPESFASNMDVKACDYGTVLDADDFLPGGTRLTRIPLSSTSYTISNDTLKNQLQNVLDSSRNYFQLRLGLDGTTNGDGIGDGFGINISDVLLQITYFD
jgi:hypothetical protein